MMLASEMRLTVSDQVARDQLAQWDDRLDRHNIEHTGIGDARLLSVVASSRERDLTGCVHGHSWGGYCEIKTVFVVQKWRGQGVGRALMEAVETEVIRRRCRQIILSTHGFQAPGFYRQLGYLCVARIEDCPLGDSYQVMVKRLP